MTPDTHGYPDQMSGIRTGNVRRHLSHQREIKGSDLTTHDGKEVGERALTLKWTSLSWRLTSDPLMVPSVEQHLRGGLLGA